MKLSKKVLLIVIIVVFAVVLGSLFTTYSRQAAELGELDDRLSRARTLLPGLIADREDLENQLASAQSLLNASQARFPEVLTSIEYDDNLFEIADGCNVAVTQIRASAPSHRTVRAVAYSVSSFDVDVEGNIEDILKFIEAIRTGEGFQLPWSAEVKSVNIDVAGSKATINLDIYGYKG